MSIDWRGSWAAVEPGSGLQRELDVELSPNHPLRRESPRVVGRCRVCDDVAVETANGEWAVVHLTWRGAAETGAFPYFERMSGDTFTRRFLDADEHL